MTVSGDDLRVTLRSWVSGVTIVTTVYENQFYGMTVSSFASVALTPPLIMVCLYKETETVQAILHTTYFGVSLLADHQTDLSTRFAGYDPEYPKDIDRFTGLETFALASGVPFLVNAVAVFDCKVWAIYDGATHHILIGEVLATKISEEPNKPLVYHNQRYHSLL